MTTFKTTRTGTLILTTGVLALAAALMTPTTALAGDRDNRDRGGDRRGDGDRDRHDGDRKDDGRGWHGDVDVRVGRPVFNHRPVVVPPPHRPGVTVQIVRPAPASYWVEGYYRTEYQQVLVEPAHYETRTEQVLIEPGHYETRYGSYGLQRVWVPDRYEVRQTQVLVPDRYETRAVSVWVPGYWATAPAPRTGWSISGLIRW